MKRQQIASTFTISVISNNFSSIMPAIRSVISRLTGREHLIRAITLKSAVDIGRSCFLNVHNKGGIGLEKHQHMLVAYFRLQTATLKFKTVCFREATMVQQ